MEAKTLNILITRPEAKAKALAQKLAPISDYCHSQPLFKLEQGNDFHTLSQTLTQLKPRFAIFISEPAVKYAFDSVGIEQWPTDITIFAVGGATASALKAQGVTHVIQPDEATTEGLLSLTELNVVRDESILIIRGNGGRELLATTLKERGAKVSYAEVYSRHWLPLTSTNTSDQWKSVGINCIVVTSNDILTRILALVCKPKVPDTYWLKHCLWVVVSERIAQSANAAGIEQIAVSHGASDDAIFQTIQRAWN